MLKLKHMLEGLRKIQERLHQQSLFSRKDFQSPQEIIQQANNLKRLRYLDQQGLFISEINKIFDSFLESENLDPEKIDYNALIALLFALRDPLPYPGQTKYTFSDEIKQYEVSLLIDTLLGKNNDFIEPGLTKESSIIAPAYLLIRALKESDSSWLNKVFFSQEDIEQLNFFREVIVKSIRFPDKRKKLEEYLEKRLDYASAWPLPKYTPLLTPLPQVLVLPAAEKLNPEKPKEEKTPIEEKKDDLENLTQEEKEIHLLSKTFAKFFEYDIKSSEIVLGEKRRKKQKLFDDIRQELSELIPSLSSLSEEQLPYFITLYALSPFSLKRITTERLSSIIELFKKSVEALGKPENQSELKNALIENSDNLDDLSILNKAFLRMIFFLANPGIENPTDEDFNNFLKQEGSLNLIFALRKLFFLRLFGEFFTTPSRFNPDTDLGFFYQFEKIKKYKRKLKENRLPFFPEFLNMKDVDILRYLAIFFIEGSLKNNLRKKDLFYTKRSQKGDVIIYLRSFKEVFGRDDLNENDILDPNSRFIFAYESDFYVVGGGIVLPIKIELRQIYEGLFEIIFFLKAGKEDLDLGYFYLKEKNQNP